MLRSLQLWSGVVAVAVGLIVGMPAASRAQDQGAAPAPAANGRIALVIGNADYQAAPLPTTANDAGLVAQTLTQAGFDVTAMGNTDGDTLRKTFRDFLAKAQDAGPDAVIFVYLSGYGLQYEGDNFLVPTDARIARDADVPVEAVRLSDFSHVLETTPAKARLFVYDLARQNPFAKSGTPLAGGLSPLQAPPGALYAFNAAPGTVAIPDAAPYGFYAKALSEMIQSPGLPMDVLFDRVRLRVSELTNGAVIPWDDAKLEGDFTFFPAVEGAPAPVAAVDPQKPIGSLPAADAYTASISRDTLSGYQDFVKAYPRDRLAPRVRSIIAARRESATWGECVRSNSSRAYWTYMRRYPRGPHYADSRRRLALIRAPLEPPPRFEIYDIPDVPPPPPEEITIVDRPYVVFQDPDWEPIPPPPDYFIPPPREAFYDDLPPPPLVPLGFLPIPAPVPLPFAYDRERYRDRYYDSGRIAQPFVPGYGRVVSENRFDRDGGSTVTLINNNNVISRTTTTVQQNNRTIVQTGGDNAVISRTTTTRGDGGVSTVQTGPTGGVLTKVVTRPAAGGGRATLVTNGNNEVISSVQSNNRGIVTNVKRGPAPVRAQNPVFTPPAGTTPNGAPRPGVPPTGATGNPANPVVRPNALPTPGAVPNATANRPNGTPAPGTAPNGGVRPNALPAPGTTPNGAAIRPNGAPAPGTAPNGGIRPNALPAPGTTPNGTAIRPNAAPTPGAAPNAQPRPNALPRQNALPVPGATAPRPNGAAPERPGQVAPKKPVGGPPKSESARPSGPAATPGGVGRPTEAPGSRRPAERPAPGAAPKAEPTRPQAAPKVAPKTEPARPNAIPAAREPKGAAGRQTEPKREPRPEAAPRKEPRPQAAPTREPRAQAPAREPRAQAPAREPRAQAPAREPRAQAPIREPRAAAPARESRPQAPPARREEPRQQAAPRAAPPREAPRPQPQAPRPAPQRAAPEQHGGGGQGPGGGGQGPGGGGHPGGGPPGRPQH